MVVGGFELPEAFVQLCEAIRRGEAPREWGLKENVDAYGRPWQVADLRFWSDPAEMQYWTEQFRHDDRFHERRVFDDFTGVANLVWFAHATDGTGYCFDFGEDPKQPSVVFFHGEGRRVAPNFASFMALFVDVRETPQWKESMKWLLGDDDDEEEDEEEEPQRGDSIWEAVYTPRRLLEAWARHYAVLRPEAGPALKRLPENTRPVARTSGAKWRRRSGKSWNVGTLPTTSGGPTRSCGSGFAPVSLRSTAAKLPVAIGMAVVSSPCVPALGPWYCQHADDGRGGAMTVGGFELPEEFVRLCEAIQRGEAPDEWELKEDVDAYGQPWKVAYLRFEGPPSEMQRLTEQIRHDYLHEDRFQTPGVIQDFTGVANFVAFASSTAGMVYCFDFGADPKEPSVVYWEDGYWRRVAPNFHAFMALFVPCKSIFDDEDEDEDEEEPPEPGDERREARQHTARMFLEAWAAQWVATPYPPSFEEIASHYATCSEEERREVEAEVRRDLKRLQVTDDQWRRHEELWERLRSSLPL